MDAITFNAQTGKHEAAYAGKDGQLNPTWHGLGQYFTEAMDTLTAFTASGLDWRVVQEAVFSMRGVNGLLQSLMEGHAKGETVWSEEYQAKLVEKHRSASLINIREDTGLELGFVSKHYQVVQNVEAFRFLDSLIDEGAMQYEAAFSLQGGKQVVVLARMPQVYQVTEGDTQVPYILMNLCHDGTGAVRFGPCMTRTICWNTLQVALEEKTNGKRRVRELSIPHKGNIQDKLNQAKNILFASQAKQEEYNDKCILLAEKRMSTAEWVQFLDIMCPLMDEKDPDYTERRQEKLKETRQAIREAYRNERQDTAPESAWAAFCAVTEHIDHLPRRGANTLQKAEARFNTTFYGPGRDMKDRAFQTACRFAGIEVATAS